MVNLIQAAREQAAQLTQAAYERAAAQNLLPAGREVHGAVETRKGGGDGDFASSFALAGAGALRMAPRQVAGVLANHMELDGTLFQRVEPAGPGYLNFFCGPRWYGGVLAAAQQLPPPLPSRPLPALPAPLAEARRRAWGDAMDNLLRRTGAKPLPAPAELGPVLLLREGRPAPDGHWAEVGQDALRFFLTARPNARPVELDLDLAVRQDGGNPLYYVWYTHARICSLLDALVEDGACADIDPALLAADEERALIKALARYPEAVRLAVRDSDPSRVSCCLAPLAGDARRFYQAGGLKREDAALQAARLKLADCARRVLADGLSLLGLRRGTFSHMRESTQRECLGGTPPGGHCVSTGRASP